MTEATRRIQQAIEQAAAALPADPSQLLVGYSGGLDSSVLLHALAQRHPCIEAIHIHHGLQAQADGWATHCRAFCEKLAIRIIIEHVVVTDDSHGPEAAARTARHAAFARHLHPGGVLALAHHLDDQAETFLMRALRGAGPDGLAAMRGFRPFHPGHLWRPLLRLPRTALLDYARQHGLAWVEDPSNTRVDFDRNYLRHVVLPPLRARWPEAAANLARAAGLQAETLALLARADAASGVDDDGETLPLPALRALPPAQVARGFRRWVEARGLPPMPARGVTWLHDQLATPAGDGAAELRWANARLLRWRDALHVDDGTPALPCDYRVRWSGRTPLALPNGLLWQLEGAEGFEMPLEVASRQGGERIHLPGRRHRHRLKQAYQDAGIAPWQRAAWPLLIAHDGELLAAGELHSARLAAWLVARGARLRLGGV